MAEAAPDEASERAKYEAMWAREEYRRYSPGEALVGMAIEALGIGPCDYVIDYGCGSGRAAQHLARVAAAVTAIEQRDPTTFGHSGRVATMTVDIARATARVKVGPYEDLSFTREQLREIRYAGLLHDFGKVGVREQVLVKSKKLPPVLLERIESRFDLIRRTLESDFHQKRAERLLENGKAGFDEFLQGLEEEYESSLKKVDYFHEAIRESNVPKILPEASAEILNEIVATTFRSFENEQVPYITPDELHFLAIPKGSLDLDERLQIQSHVTHTYNFLMQIPWTASLAQVADIAHGNHERLDGTGYPRGIEADDIALQTRIMTVSDIFDALTASDRPYKSALSETRALEILDLEAEAGMLDHCTQTNPRAPTAAEYATLLQEVY